jgi:hypothetical protein
MLNASTELLRPLSLTKRARYHWATRANQDGTYILQVIMTSMMQNM